MEMYPELLRATIKKARKCYILEPTLEGKAVWMELIVKFKKELHELKTNKVQ